MSQKCELWRIHSLQIGFPTAGDRISVSSASSAKGFVFLTEHCHLNRKSCRRLSYLSMTRVPTFSILALGLKLETHTLVRGLMDALFKTLYTASISLQTFLILSTVCLLICFRALSLWYDVFRDGNPCLRDNNNNECFWNSRPNLGVFYWQYQHRLVPCAIDKWKQLDPL